MCSFISSCFSIIWENIFFRNCQGHAFQLQLGTKYLNSWKLSMAQYARMVQLTNTVWSKIQMQTGSAGPCAIGPNLLL